MSALQAQDDPHALHGLDDAAIARWNGPASKRIVTGYGFWIFILSDMIMFAAFFATYAVLHGETAGGPGGHDLFDLRNVAIETMLLLASSFSCGLASIAADVTPELARATIASVSVLGALHASAEIRAALADRTR